MERQDILEGYQHKADTAKARGKHRESDRLDVTDVLTLRILLHPTAKAESRIVTRKLIEYLCDKKVCKAEDIYNDLGLSNKTVLSRLLKLRNMALIHRAQKKYYIATERLYELRDKYIDKVCGE